MPERLFVYGTLMPGESRWPVLAPYLNGAPVPDRINGRLMDTGAGYPALITSRNDRMVDGWVVTLDPTRAAPVLVTLDNVEGVDVGLFTRASDRTESGRDCWVYRYLCDTSGMSDLGSSWADRSSNRPA